MQRISELRAADLLEVVAVIINVDVEVLVAGEYAPVVCIPCN